MARNVLAEMAGKYARAGVVAAADAVPDNDRYSAAAIEAVDRLRRCRARESRDRRNKERGNRERFQFFAFS
jgi:hypothetical protein